MDKKAIIVHYCNYQERCHQEVRNKLYEIGCHKQEVEELISYLIESNLLNEERYAQSFARGKFRLKNWGRNKIIHELRKKKISDYCIRKSMLEIDDVDYEETINKIAEKKYKELCREKNNRIREQKIYRYLLQKGFESNVINTLIKKMKDCK